MEPGQTKDRYTENVCEKAKKQKNKNKTEKQKKHQKHTENIKLKS